MKCDRLKSHKAYNRCIDEGWPTSNDDLICCEYYLKSEVDEAIAELKARIADLEKLNHDLCERVTENDEIRLHWEEIEQTRAENESLKAKLENVQASAYADSVDAGMRERRLKRALYKACAMWADRTRLICSVFGSSASRISWERMKGKCQAKAEEYK